MQSIEPFQASLLFKAVKFHFTQDKYDYVMYNGKVSGDTIANKQKFLYNKTRYSFAKLARHKDPEGLLVSNFILNPKAFITDVVTDEGYNIYETWINRKAARYYNLEQDLRKFSSIKEVLHTKDLPIIIEKYIQEEIHPESVTLINRVTGVLNKLDDKAHPLLEGNVLKLRKYISFIPYDIKKVKSIFETIWNH